MSVRELKDIVKKYDGKVAKLLSLGRKELDNSDNCSYVERFGFTNDDAEQLLQLAQDMEIYNYDYDSEEEGEAVEFFAVVHAWYILSELEILEAKELFMNMLKDRGDSDDYDEWFLSAFSELIKPFRKDMYETVVQVAQSEDCGTWARAECVNLIEEMIKAKEVEPSLVDKFIVKVLNTNEDSIVNASVISICRDEKLTHHHELIKECFARKAVDIDYVGDLEDVEIYMGLRVERETKKETTEMQNKFDSLYDVINRAIDEETVSLPSVQNEPKLGRNDPCPCGSGKKYKKCCLNK